jgi:hypothetical protein
MLQAECWKWKKKPMKDDEDDGQQLRMFQEPEQGKSKKLSPVISRLIEPVPDEQPDQIDYLHTVLCQVGMPRNKTDAKVFERVNGGVFMRLKAGEIFDGTKFVDQPLPYGTKPRLVMVHISGEAVRTRNPIVEVGDSVREFLKRLDIDTNGGPRGGYTMFKKQMQALAACHLTLGFNIQNRAITINTQPIETFEAWLQNDGKGQTTMWPGKIELSQKFYETLIEYAVPLDPRHLAKLKHSSLALDIYTWLAHRLYRINHRRGVVIHWKPIKEQFGQEYNDFQNFKKRYLIALREVLIAYNDANVEVIDGGLLLKPSKPPIEPRTSVRVDLPYSPGLGVNPTIGTIPAPAPKQDGQRQQRKPRKTPKP